MVVMLIEGDATGESGLMSARGSLWLAWWGDREWISASRGLQKTGERVVIQPGTDELPVLCRREASAETKPQQNISSIV